LEKGDKFLYRVYAEPAAEEGNGRATGVVATVRRRSLPLVAGRLADWLADARPTGPMDDQDYPLFMLDRARELAREYCRKPGDKEGGALLVGRLFRQNGPEPEIFGVLEDAIEAEYAEQELFSLDLTPRGFAHLHQQLLLRRTRLGRGDEVALAFSH